MPEDSAQATPHSTSANQPNALAGAASPYLRSAAHQPVRWVEWGPAAFERAAREDKPILLDIGAVWCHWCHVIDRESYENEAIAGVINTHFVPVKVDRDERPDVDARYQMAVSALTGQGGWPLTAFLTPAGQPFYGGTYFPPDDRYGRPGMMRVLQTVAQNYSSHRAEIHSSAAQIADALGRAEGSPAAGSADRAALDAIVAGIEELYDPEHGGFGRAPKFPHPAALELLLDRYLESGSRRSLEMVTSTLESMGRGGVYDQIGGGFHRYSVDEHWGVPHFEKMSYDNSGLLRNYLRAHELTGDEFFREIAMGILSFVESVLSRPEGGFYASQDADYSLDDDGDYFTWTLDELRAALDEQEVRVAALRYEVGSTGEMHHNPAKNVLFIDQPVEAISARVGMDSAEVAKILERAKAKMLAARRARPTPFIDRSLYAGWNAMMASALLEASNVLELEGARGRALMALDLFLECGWDPARGMAHVLSEANSNSGAERTENSVGLTAANFDLLEDQVLMVSALLDAFEATGQRRYFERALQLADLTVRRFWDSSEGGFFDTAVDAADRQGALTIRRKPWQDSPTPAGNSVAAAALDRLASLADRSDLREKAQLTLGLFATRAAEIGLHAGAYGLTLAHHLRPPLQIVIVGRPEDPKRLALVRAARASRTAGKRILLFTPADLTADLPAGLAATLPNLPLSSGPVAVVCSGSSCQPPAATPEELNQAMERASRFESPNPPAR
jgi:uncharacterized protein